MRGQRLQGIKHDYFNQIDDPVKAYLFGFYLADGSMEVNQTGRFCIRIAVHERDEQILKLFQAEISPNSPITIMRRKKLDCYRRLSITSTPIGETFLSLGIPQQRKATGFRFPPLDQGIQRDVIRGFFDGDGTAGCYIYKDNVVRQVSMVSQKQEFLSDISNILTTEGINCKVLRHRKYYYLTIRGYREWYNYLYPGITALPRKQKNCELCTLTSSEIKSLKAIDPCNA